MMQILFCFTFNTETKEAIFSGNIEILEALQILQGLAIADGVRGANEEARKAEQKDS